MIVSIPADYDLLYIVYHFRPLIQLSLLFILITFFSWYFQLIIMEVLPIISSSKHIMIKLKAQTIPQRQIDFINNHPDENIFRFDNIIRNLWPISSTTLNEKTIIHYDDLYQSHLSWITSSQQTGDPRLCWEVQVTYLRGDNDNFSCSLEKKIGTKEARKSNIVEININHIDFEGRASWGINVRKNASDVDEYGNVHGVAKLARVIAVKVLGKERRGAWSDWSVRRDLFASGTSMASPHVAGVIALIISQRGNMAPAKMKELLKSMATYGALKNAELTASNIILYVNKSI
ncbi:unnamed protein product [Rhizophagus irregularis]|nr:unnamed protein product [Rhizophagus irregularis]